MRLRHASYSIKRPRILNPVKGRTPDSTALQVIYVKGESPPRGESPTEWFLAASEPVDSSEEAYEYVGYHMPRWKIERFRYALKSGRAIERLQERSVGKTTALVLMRPIIAAMMLDMTYAARLAPEHPAPFFWGGRIVSQNAIIDSYKIISLCINCT
ncbi:MAG: hypothetical protein LBD58_07675 [Treponema sp.]|nr:hypothetical protein [Treponema sp.]